MPRFSKFGLFALLALLLTLLHATNGLADEGSDVRREAVKHFERGVGLYSEADYRAALVEFKRAAELAPNDTVLYNIGQTEYQLRDYAAALSTFERYLAEAAPAEGHRSEIENSVRILRTRVATLSVTTLPVGAEISIDDQPIGRTPFASARRVNIGRIKLTATMTGRAPIVRIVDMAAEEHIQVDLVLPPATAATAFPFNAPSTEEADGSASGSSSWQTVGWVATGTLGAGTIVFGILALKKSNDLENLRNTFPTTSQTLESARNTASTYAVVADSLAIGTLVVGGITLFSTLSSSGEKTKTPSAGMARLKLGVGTARLEATF